MSVEYGPICKMDTALLAQVMQRVEELLRNKGGGNDGKSVFSFCPQEVEGILIKKAGEGPDMLFRLRDGRTFDSYGRPAP